MDNQKESSPLIPSASLQSDAPPISETYDVLLSKTTPFKTYKRRWYILTMYTAIALVCNMDWNTWGPIAEPCKIVFGWRNWQVLFLSSWAAISIILSAGPSTWIMDKKGKNTSDLEMCYRDRETQQCMDTLENYRR
jgi:hypothetical protein